MVHITFYQKQSTIICICICLEHNNNFSDFGSLLHTFKIIHQLFFFINFFTQRALYARTPRLPSLTINYSKNLFVEQSVCQSVLDSWACFKLPIFDIVFFKLLKRSKNDNINLRNEYIYFFLNNLNRKKKLIILMTALRKTYFSLLNFEKVEQAHH